MDKRLDTVAVEMLIELPMILDNRMVDVSNVDRATVDPTVVEVVIAFMLI